MQTFCNSLYYNQQHPQHPIQQDIVAQEPCTDQYSNLTEVLLWGAHKQCLLPS